MRHIFLPLILLLGLASCHSIDEYADNPRGNFEALWSILDEHYCFFREKGVDWEEVHSRYAPMVADRMTSRELFDVMARMLDELRDGNGYRPSELHKCLPEATPRVLDIQLKEMAEDGLVVKTIFPELPPRSEYRITPLGASLLPIIDAMLRWGEEHFDVFEKKYGNPGGNSTCSKSIK